MAEITENIKESKKKYNKKIMKITIEYPLKDEIEGKRLKEYLTQCNISANKYIKELIRKDLDEKGFFI